MPEFETAIPDKPTENLRCPAAREGWAHDFKDALTTGSEERVIFCGNCGEVRPLVLPDPSA